MKKIISVSIALCLAITSLFTGICATAANKVTSADVKEKIEDAATFVAMEKMPFSETNLYYLTTCINSGINLSACKTDFVDAVKSNLSTNGGKILTTKYNSTTWSQESLETAEVYAGVIYALEYFGYDPTSFEGYDLVECFKNVDVESTKSYENPYCFAAVFKVAEKYSAKYNITTDYVKYFAENFYQIGTGSTYSQDSDSASLFVVAMSPYYSSYSAYIDDALNQIEACKTTGGYYSTSAWGDTSANSDSTGLALAAYSSVGNLDKANEIYSELTAFESTDLPGTYTASYDPVYSTHDALIGLECYYTALKAKEDSDATSTTESTTEPTTATATTTTTTTTTTASVKTSVVSTPKKTSIKKLTKGKKKITVQWKKVSGVKGYQVQVATNKKFTKNKKTVTISKQKTTKTTTKKLKSKKKYYVRVRTYKTVNGKKVYSSWSKVKTVKTK